MKKHWIILIAVVALAAVVTSVFLLVNASKEKEPESAASTFALAEATYPEQLPFPNKEDYTRNGDLIVSTYHEAYRQWATAKRERSQALPDDYAEGLEDFLTDSIRQFLSGADHEKNIAYSPLNVYMALAMLAETTDGESRQQILDLLGSDSIEALREQASAIWNTTYCNDGARTSILANSLWLNEEIHFNQATMDTLADTYYASSYQGEMGSAEFNAALQAWLNEQTGGLLSDQISNVNMTEQIILALASTIYFRDKWGNEFSERYTEESIFHTVSGDVTCDFMRQSSERNYYWGELFTAVYQAFEGGGGMWLVLPDEGVTTDDLLANDEAMQFLLCGGRWEKRSAPLVNLSLPKFDISSQIDLCEGLQALGVTDVFDYTISDFTPMTIDTSKIFVSQATHGVRVQIDEEGCTAAAYIVMMAGGSDPINPEDEVDFILDRPFVFAIAGTDGLPLFAGIVNQPG